MARNVELKARLADLAAVRKIAQRLATANLGIQQQTDTYFHCRHGRLKLREIAGQPAQLIPYRRPDCAGAKGSEYRLVEVPNAIGLKQALTAALGVLAVVDKVREVFLVENVRIHLDEVAGLGKFIEFEAVLTATVDESVGQSQVAQLQRDFGIRDSDLVSGSYSDLLLAAR
jgi:predicted adenylyl cyclase CyaB